MSASQQGLPLVPVLMQSSLTAKTVTDSRNHWSPRDNQFKDNNCIKILLKILNVYTFLCDILEFGTLLAPLQEKKGNIFIEPYITQ